MRPINDLCKVQVSTDEFKFGGDQGKTESGILVELPSELPFFGFHSFAFEESYDRPINNKNILDYYQKLVGKRVYWKGLSERGMVWKEGDNTWAFVKLTDIVAYSEPEIEATLVLSGEFKV